MEYPLLAGTTARSERRRDQEDAHARIDNDEAQGSRGRGENPR